MELQKFIIELGSDFAFMARQKRIVIDGEDHRIDLLFHHRRLRRLVAIDLKLGRFKAAYKRQMECYLGWLKQYEMLEGEASPIDLTGCTATKQVTSASGYRRVCGLWTDIARSGAGGGLVGSADQIVEKINRYIDMGVRSFIFSGYPLMDEATYFAQSVSPRLSTISMPVVQARLPKLQSL